jgi:hypothetical protein
MLHGRNREGVEGEWICLSVDVQDAAKSVTESWRRARSRGWKSKNVFLGWEVGSRFYAPGEVVAVNWREIYEVFS